MTGWLPATVALMVGGLGPGMWLLVRGAPLDRLIGLELTSAVTTLVLVLWAHVAGPTQYLVVPLVLVVLSFAGTLVFLRLLEPPRGTHR